MSLDIQTISNQYLINNTTNFVDQGLQQKYRSILGLQQILQISSGTIFLGSVSISSYLNILGNSSFINPITCNSNINVLNNLYLNNNITIGSNLFINGLITITNNTNINNVNVSNNSIFNGNISTQSVMVLGNTLIQNSMTSLNIFANNVFLNNITCSNIFISSNSLLQNLTLNNTLIISNTSIFQNTVSCLSNLTVSNLSIINNLNIQSKLNSQSLITQNTVTINSNLLVSNLTIINNNLIVTTPTVFNTNLNVLGTLTTNNLSILGNITINLPEYPNAASALAAGLPYYSLYKTGDIVKILIDIYQPIVTLNGNSIINLYLGDSYIDPGISISDNLGENLLPIINGTVNVNVVGVYNLSYYTIDSFNNYSNTVLRTVNVYAYPTISNIAKNSNLITFSTTSIFNIITYQIKQSNNIIISETVLNINSINIDTLTLSGTPYFITIFLKQDNTRILNTTVFALTNINIGPVLTFIDTNPYSVRLSVSFNIFTNISAYNLPNNSNIDISSSNVTIYNTTLNQSVTTPTNGILTKNLNDAFTLTYTITGTNNNIVSQSRTILTINDIPPTITLLGENPMISYVGSNFVDPGYTITDITNETLIPTIVGTVNTTTQGIYKLSYTVTNSYNLTTTVIRNIYVMNTRAVYRTASLLFPTQRYYRPSTGERYYSFDQDGLFYKFNTNLCYQLNQKNQWTIETWIFIYQGTYTAYNSAYPPPSDNRPNTSQSIEYIFSLVPSFKTSLTSGRPNDIISLSIYGNRDIQFNILGGGFQGRFERIYNKWIHIALVYTGTHILGFIDGYNIVKVSQTSNPITGTLNNPDYLYIGTFGYFNLETYQRISDTDLATSGPKYAGYIGQLSFLNYAKYSSNFIPDLDLLPSDMSTSLFYLGDNYLDIVSNQYSSNYISGGTLADTRIKLYMGTMMLNLVYAFPGSDLTYWIRFDSRTGSAKLVYWVLHDKTKGTPWDSIDPSIQLYDYNQDYSNGFTISLIINNFNYNGPLIYIGQDADNPSNPFVYISVTDYIDRNFNDSTGIRFKLTVNYNSTIWKTPFECSWGLIVISFDNTNKCWINGILVSTNFIYNKNFFMQGIWIGRYNGLNFMSDSSIGVSHVTNIKIYNAVIPYNIIV